MPTLRAVLDAVVEQAGSYALEAPPEWSQGRTLYGGMTTALCFHAAQQAKPDLPPLRSAQVAFVGPASSHLRFTPSVLRQGKSSVILGVDCFSAMDGRADAGMAARAIFTYGAGRDSSIAHDFSARANSPAALSADLPADLLGPDACPAFAGPGAFTPTFFQNFDVRLAAGRVPVSGGGAPDFTVWVRHLDATGVDPVVALLALADAPPPAAMVQFKAFAPISTMTWGIDLFHPIAANDRAAGGWHLLRSHSEQAAHGYSLQAMEVWNAAGARVAAARQMVALFA